MSRYRSEVTEELWGKLSHFLPKQRASKNGGPKPLPSRPCFEGILWVLRTGARWQDMPDDLPSGSTCWRRLRFWHRQGIWRKAWRAFLSELDEKRRLEWSECFADGSFAPAKKGAKRSEKPRKARVQNG